jgi:outer membrane protein assembly factor BamB
MLKYIARGAGGALVGLIGGAAVLYLAGLRIVLDGGGMPRLEFAQSADERAEAIARHREAQRRAAPSPIPPPAPEPGSTDAEPASPTTPATEAVPAAAAATSPPAPYWTTFRGPSWDGHYRERSVDLDWPETGITPAWKQPVGGGYASFVTDGRHAFTIEQRADEEVAAAYEITTGRELWTNSWNAVFRERMGGDGPRATPTWHEGRVYALGGAGELRAIDAADGRTIWRTNILDDAGASNLQWGMAAAPLIVDDTVVVLPGGGSGRSVVAYDRYDGTVRWTSLDDTASYASPMLVTLAGTRQILAFTAERLVGLSPDRGKLLWEFPWKTQYGVNASQPLLLGDDRVFISTGYGAGAASIQVSHDPSGAYSVRELWRTNRMKNQFTSSLLHDGFIYGLDEAILACIDAETGAIKWKGGRYGYGQVMLVDGHLIVVTEAGDLALVRATPDAHVELARFPAIEGKSWNHPAMAGGFLLIRNVLEMAAFDLRPGGRR